MHRNAWLDGSNAVMTVCELSSFNRVLDLRSSSASLTPLSSVVYIAKEPPFVFLFPSMTELVYETGDCMRLCE
jgi:hypothetical protein